MPRRGPNYDINEGEIQCIIADKGLDWYIENTRKILKSHPRNRYRNILDYLLKLKDEENSKQEIQTTTMN